MKRLLTAMTSLIFSTICVLVGGIITNATESGQNLQYVIEEDSVYYESAFGFGTGRRGVVNEQNPYTTAPCYAGINGYAFLDEKGRILGADYEEDLTDIFIPPPPEGTVRVFKHFKTSNYRNGWVDSDSVMKQDETSEPVIENELSEETPVEPEKIVEKIKEDTQDVKTAIIIDFSGSMEDNQREVVDLLKKLEFGQNTTIIVFGTTYEVITTEQLKNEDFYVGSETHMYQAINHAIELATYQVILISDLGTYDDVDLMKNDTIKKLKVYDPESFANDLVLDELKEKLGVEISRTIIQDE